MKFHEAVKILREQKHFSQKQVCKGIVDISGYSRFENGINKYGIDIIHLFLKNLNATFSDLDHILQTQNTVTNYYYLLDIAITGEHTESEIIEIFNYFNTHKNDHPKTYSSYILCKKYFSAVYPAHVPKLTENEILAAYTPFATQSYHTYNDYVNFADISELLTLDQCKIVIFNLLSVPIKDVMCYKKEVQSIYLRVVYNLADELIDYNELELAKFAIDQLLTRLEKIKSMLISCSCIYSQIKIKLLMQPQLAETLTSEINEMKVFLEKYANEANYSNAIWDDFQNKLNGVQKVITVFD